MACLEWKRIKEKGVDGIEQEWKAVSMPQNGKQMGCTLVHTQGIIQPGRRSEVLCVSLPRLNVLETQMGKDVLFWRSCQELFLEEGQASKHKVSDVSRSVSRWHLQYCGCVFSFLFLKMSVYVSFNFICKNAELYLEKNLPICVFRKQKYNNCSLQTKHELTGMVKFYIGRKYLANSHDRARLALHRGNTFKVSVDFLLVCLFQLLLAENKWLPHVSSSVRII